MGKPVRPVTPYLDASVIVALFKDEDHSTAARNWAAEVEMRLRASALGLGEVQAAFARLVRDGEWTLEAAREVSGDADSWASQDVEQVALLNIDVVVAGKFVRTPLPKLLMADAIHLAICQRLGLTLVTFDKDLLIIAAREGVAALRPA